MSGHSKWHRIKRKKATVDNKRGQEFTRLTKQIISAARGNPNPDQNTALRDIIARAKQANMPQDNINRVLQRTGGSSGQIQIYEAFGPGGVALLIMANTDNNNRTTSELRHILKNHGGSLSEPGGVKWKFITKTTPGKFTAKYLQETDQATRQKTRRLLEALNEHQDIEQVVTDITAT